MRQRSDLVFPMAEFGRRLAELRQRMAARGVDAVLVTTPENLFYLTGYETQGLWYFNGLVVPLDGEPFMVTRVAEDSVVEDTTWVERRRPFRDVDDAMAILARAIDEFALARKRIGYEKDSYFFRASEQEPLFALCPNARFVDCSGVVEAGRVIKSPLEIELMQKAAAATTAGMRAGIGAVRAGATENDVAAEVYGGMLRAGGDYPALAPFIVSGPRGAVSHATWRGRRIEKGDVVFFEVGGCFRRYHAPMMRTVYVGALTPKLSEAEGLVREALEAAMVAIKPGAATGEADAAARKVIARNSFGATQYTRVGYGMGIACAALWGEGHIIDIKPGDTRAFRENMTFHVIPYLQIPGEAAVGISETVRVTATGSESFMDFERRVFTA